MAERREGKEQMDERIQRKEDQLIEIKEGIQAVTSLQNKIKKND